MRTMCVDLPLSWASVKSQSEVSVQEKRYWKSRRDPGIRFVKLCVLFLPWFLVLHSDIAWKTTLKHFQVIAPSVTFCLPAFPRCLWPQHGPHLWMTPGAHRV